MARRTKAAAAQEQPAIHPRFEGSAYSNQEIDFLLDHLGEPAIVALGPEVELPDGVNEEAVSGILDLTYQLDLYQSTMRDKTGDGSLETWCGFERVRQVLEETKSWRAQVRELRRRTRGSAPELRRAVNAPSLHFWDPTTDIPYYYGEGADADRVLHALAPDGVRIPLYTELSEVGGAGALKSLAGVAKFIRSSSQAEQQTRVSEATPSELEVEVGDENSTIRCPICRHAEEFETNRAMSKRSAHTKMLQHLKQASSHKERHRLLLTRLQSGKAGSVKNKEQAQALVESRA